ncbi:MAG: tRNA (adenosine(37)-N6)-threonylcarbamoyltransferase complex ATPase subunit type 1 TsaE [Clostridia bacterium]|nr:tRNA (adenosine(37)-N6)-threonylcarbamoyltransferase complex ATPase subunit type 1 TsaE [Clostridia bacterium]
MKSIITKSEKETNKVAANFAKTCKKGDVVLLFGDLGAGKTVFSKGFVSAFSKSAVTSPTFTIINTYEGKIPVYHFDLYRIENEGELDLIGILDYLYGDGICLIEWPERAPNAFPKNSKKVEIKKRGENVREIIFYEDIDN